MIAPALTPMPTYHAYHQERLSSLFVVQLIDLESNDRYRSKI